MKELVKIEKCDNLGNGIGFINNKIVFVPKAVVGDTVEVVIKKENKNYQIGELKKIVDPSKSREKVLCPYYFLCGGCDFLGYNYKDTNKFKLNLVNDYFRKSGINFEVREIICGNSFNYRNKITLKVVNGIVGYFESKTHKILEIKNCLLVNEKINDILKDINTLNISNGEVVIRVNYKSEYLISIVSKDKTNINYIINNYNVSGIVLNNESIYKNNYFIDKIGNYLFKVSYNSFFQVNPYVCSKLFDLIKENTKFSKKVVDLYCGVGTLSLISSESSESVLGVEIVKNAIKDANYNKKLNNINNVAFICEDSKNVIDKIDESVDTIILDPPRSGVDKKVIDRIIKCGINKVIYISCNPVTLVRDINYLKDYYDIKDAKLLDMFFMTKHVECVLVLYRKSLEK